MSITVRKSLKLLGLIAFLPLVSGLLSLLLGSAVTIGGFSLMHFAEWQQWQLHHYWFFLTARLIGFSLAAWGWVQFRRRTLAIQPAALHRLKRAEATAVLGILLIELVRAGSMWETLA